MTDRLQRLIAVGDLAAEVAADWVASQTIPAGVLAADHGGLYEQPEQRGYALLALWLNGSTLADVPCKAETLCLSLNCPV